jgi:hypothetical protein
MNPAIDLGNITRATTGSHCLEKVKVTLIYLGITIKGRLGLFALPTVIPVGWGAILIDITKVTL